MTYSIQWFNDGAYRCFSGFVSGDEYVKCSFNLHQDLRYTKADYIINDYRQVIAHNLDEVHVEAISTANRVLAKTKSQLRIALIIPPNNPAMLALANIYIQQTVDLAFECRVFFTLPQAIDWARYQVATDSVIQPRQSVAS
ncbi:MAG: hypothetical protein OEW58_03335 [Gammaproteobacteria bacterium]|nr:hypothetical protein [Gammaproteobacteria bacterium]